MKLIWKFNKSRTEAKGEDKKCVVFINKIDGKDMFNWRIVDKEMGSSKTLEEAIKTVEKILNKKDK